jgi:hypothetical protein
MNATTTFPAAIHWSAQDLADAVPLRLHELFEVAGLPARAGNAGRLVPSPRRWRAGYAAVAPLPPRFRID